MMRLNTDLLCKQDDPRAPPMIFMVRTMQLISQVVTSKAGPSFLCHVHKRLSQQTKYDLFQGELSWPNRTYRIETL